MSNYWHDREHAAKLEKSGARVVAPGYPDWVFYVKPVNDWATDYQRAVARVAALPASQVAVTRIKSDGYVETVEDRAEFAAMARAAFAEGCITSWEGVANRDGAPLECTPANAAEVLAHFPDIYAHVLAFAKNAAKYKPLSAADKIAAVAGNLPPASNTARVRGGKR